MDQQRSARVDDHLELSISNLGTQQFYSAYSLNISHTGILLACYEVVPFCKATLLEVIIDPEGRKISEPVYALAEIARIAKGDSTGLEKYKDHLGEDKNLRSVMGIFFKQFDGRKHEVWENYINDHYKSLGWDVPDLSARSR
ncbi:MAG: hypothetical protein HRU09_15100 [Oligoflexales bacterium]|nr:hypothetical protein [Oligoflexales bacterium]